MNTYEVTVRDAAGYTFTFTYQAESEKEARDEFRQGASRQGVTKFSNIKILEVNRIN